MSQIPLLLSLPEVYSADSFFVTDCNKAAYTTILDENRWVGHALYLCGEKSSGKSHLAHIWQEKFSAIFISPANIKPENITNNCVLDDIEYCKDEEALLHLYNHCKDIGVRLLLTSSFSPSSLPFTLADLTSRLRGCQVAIISQPDDDLIANVMRKQFSDRQLMVDEDVLTYLVPRMDRTLEGVSDIVGKIDSNALAEKKNITIPFVKKLFGF